MTTGSLADGKQLQVHARKCTTVDELRIIATNPIEDPVRAICAFMAKHHLHEECTFDDCSRDEFVQSSKGLQGLMHGQSGSARNM
ncbi:uncharacterized protein PITG_20822 [Phytophthora infestans T30-4]|uniref:Uncharacterized protein n=1 Tax=Phytophthora infestans (strain T30-4) TaxID=403677 RepID=D0P2V5_PHYIT|nr:uncharacterized protein PITG_20822 [Phytophthora infestans T30-4]EEY57092.1 hypothetical protein PITG_20822 [Phytophthora infestans T30-4]|eukprot:XP_002895369.1 hypothetical protein PITG_20822 [Phytophthora infestans T30-4]